MARAAVLLHGFTNTGRSWDPVVEALGERYTAIAPDLRGHGAASVAEPVTLAAVLDDLAALVPEAAVLAGYSQGGRIALHAALDPRLRDRLAGLVLVGASPGLADPAERAARRATDEALAAELEGSTIEVFATRWARTPVLAGVPAAVAARQHADRLRNTPAGLARALRGLGTGALPPLWDRLAALTVPVTVLVGEGDTKFREIAAAMAERLPAARIITVPGTGHAVHLEAPAAVADAISSGAGDLSP